MKHAGLCLGVLLVLAAGPAVADADWIGAGTGGVTATDPADPATWWENPDNWAAGQVPVSSDVARLPFSNAGAVYADAGGAEGIYVDGPATDAALYFGEGADFVVGRTMYLGYEANGRAVQTGGTVMIEEALKIASGPLRSSGSSGTYELHGGSLTVGARSVISRLDVYLGHMGAGTFIQTGGVHTVTNNLKIALEPGSAGTYLLSGGELTVGRTESVGTLGTGVFTQTGGANTVEGQLAVGTSDMGSGTYELAGGTLVAKELCIGFLGPGLVQQTGGSATAELCRVEGLGRYEMAGGAFAAQRLTLTGLFDQTGGSSTIGCLEILPSGYLVYTGGTLEISGLVLDGTLDLGSAEVCLSAKAAVVDLTGGRIENGERATLAMDHGLLVAPPGFDPLAVFGACTGVGAIHVPGQTLVIEPGQELHLGGVFMDPIETAGTLIAGDGGLLDLRGRLVMTGGRVDLGGGALVVHVPGGALSGGALTTARVGVGSGGAFTQTGGVLRTASLSVAPGAAGDEPAYTLAGGEIFADSVLVSGSTFTHAGGHLTVTDSLSVETHSPTQRGATYALSAGSLVARSVSIDGQAYADSVFQQTGGTHTVAEDLFVSSGGIYRLEGGTLEAGAVRSVGRFVQSHGTASIGGIWLTGWSSIPGTYVLSGGTLNVAGDIHAGRCAVGGCGTFVQMGGTNTVAGSLSIDTVGTYCLEGGVLEVAAVATYGTFSQTGGRHAISDLLYIGGKGIDQGLYTLAGGQLSADSLDVAAGGRMDLTGGQLADCGSTTIGGELGVIGCSQEIRGPVVVEGGGLLRIQQGCLSARTLDVAGRLDLAGGEALADSVLVRGEPATY